MRANPRRWLPTAYRFVLACAFALAFGAGQAQAQADATSANLSGFVRDPAGAVVTFPGVAPVAMQEGRYAAKVVRDRLRGRETPPFRYSDKGNLATIGRAAAVADIKGLRLSGLIAWLIWLFVHLWYLVGFQNRLLVFIQWFFSFATHGRGARLITEPAASAARGDQADN